MKILRRIRQEWSNILLELRARLTPRRASVANEVPYVSQFASPKYSEEILKNKVAKTSDPEWKNAGAESPEEYAKWVTTQCGMACASMALQFWGLLSMPVVRLAKEALEHGVYHAEGSELSDMRYREFKSWIFRRGIKADVYSRLTILGIKALISDGALVMVSVNPNIRGYDTAPKDQRGGHLVLVTGYDDTKGTITINNPSGFVSLDTQVAHEIKESEFRSFFAGRGIALRQSA